MRVRLDAARWSVASLQRFAARGITARAERKRERASLPAVARIPVRSVAAAVGVRRVRVAAVVGIRIATVVTEGHVRRDEREAERVVRIVAAVVSAAIAAVVSATAVVASTAVISSATVVA